MWRWYYFQTFFMTTSDIAGFFSRRRFVWFSYVGIIQMMFHINVDDYFQSKKLFPIQKTLFNSRPWVLEILEKIFNEDRLDWGWGGGGGWSSCWSYQNFNQNNSPGRNWQFFTPSIHSLPHFCVSFFRMVDASGGISLPGPKMGDGSRHVQSDIPSCRVAPFSPMNYSLPLSFFSLSIRCNTLCHHAHAKFHSLLSHCSALPDRDRICPSRRPESQCKSEKSIFDPVIFETDPREEWKIGANSFLSFFH